MLGDILNHANIFRNQRSNSELGGGKVNGNIPETSQSKLCSSEDLLGNSLSHKARNSPERMLL